MSKPIDKIIRVSRVGGREGDSFISPEVQEKQIDAYLSAYGLTPGETFTELDISGGKVTSRKSIQAILERIESGESGGLIVAKLDRFARNVKEALEVIDRLHAAGGRLICVEQQFDTTTPIGRVILTILLAFAQLERDTRKEGFKVAQREAVSRGVHVSGFAPCGYMRPGQGRPLALDPLAWEHVYQAGMLALQGDAWGAVADYLNDNGVKGSRGGRWIPSSVRRMFNNRAYLGEARSGEFVFADAHPAIFTEDEFAAINRLRKPKAARKGGVAETALLRGIAVCGTCHKPLIAHTHVKGNHNYVCQRRRSGGTCEAGASMMIDRLDGYVEATLQEAMEGQGALVEALDAAIAVEAAQREAHAAQHNLDEFLRNTTLITILGADKFNETAADYQRAVDLARMSQEAALGDKREQEAVLSYESLNQWREGVLSNEERRLLMGALLDRVEVKRGHGTTPIEKKVRIILRGNVVLEPREAAVLIRA